MKVLKTFFLTVGLTAWLPLAGFAGDTGKPAFDTSQFISPQICGGCHGDIYAQWENSMHNLAHHDPVYQKVAKFFVKGLTDPAEIKESESCVKCHTPVGFVTGNPRKTSDEFSSVPDIAQHGIQCDFCHSATGATKMYNNGMTLAPGEGEIDPGVKRGPRKDAVSGYHDTAFSEFHTSAKICGTCHNVKHVAFKTDLETTYDEWLKSPYNTEAPETRVTCQGCHMHQRPGVPATGATPRPDNPGLACDFGPERPHVFTHNFVGANGVVPGQFGDDTKTQMAAERLQNAAALTLDTTGIKNDRLRVTVTNTGAGHKLPTGLTNARQMWIEIKIKNKTTGKILFTAGVPDKNGYVPDDTVMYNTVFGDGQGNPVINISKAREILRDYRILPKQSVTETFNLPPELPETGLEIRARLCYRTFSQKQLDMVMDKGKTTMPVISMAEAAAAI
ncbi:MAG: multiheme c-type cytochrome [Thermodesulfobacteriota bacterium]|nr:multiheme c-type cytochrome [Thermodesulfobacteriota bacterium]